MNISMAKQIERSCLVLANTIIVLACISFVLSHTLSASFENRFLYSGVVLALTTLLLRFAFSDIQLLHRTMYRIATIMTLWAFGLYLLSSPSYILYIIIIPAVYFLLRIEIKPQRMLEDQIAAGLVFGLGAFLYIQQQPLQVLLFEGYEFDWKNYLFQAPVIIICGLGLMRLNKYADWPGLVLLGATLLIAGLTLTLAAFIPTDLFIHPVALATIIVSHLCLTILYVNNPIIKAIIQFCAIGEQQQQRFRIILFIVLNIALQATLFVLVTAHNIDYRILLFMVMCVGGMLYAYRHYSVAISLLESAFICFPILYLLMPQVGQYLVIPMALIMVVSVLLRRLNYPDLAIPNWIITFIFLFYLALIFQFRVVSPIGLAELGLIFVSWLLTPRRPFNLGYSYHGALLPVITAVTLVCLSGGFNTVLLPLWALLNLLLVLGLLGITYNKKVIRFAIAKKWYFIKSWQRRGKNTLLFVIALATIAVAISVYYDYLWYSNRWEPMIELLAIFTISIAVMLRLTVKQQSTRYALLTETYIWFFLIALRWKLELMEVMRLGSPIDGYVLIGAACIVAGLREIIRRHAHTFDRYFQRTTILYAILGWSYFLVSYYLDQAHYHNELSAMILSVMFFVLSRSNRKINLILSFVFGNAAVLVYFIHQDIANVLFYVLPVLISVLVLAHLFREELDDRQQRAIRLYCSLIILAISAFYNVTDFNESVWYPVTATLIAAIGVVGGISLRVRIYLYLGAMFFLANISTVVIHVIVNQPPENTKLVIGVVFLLAGLLFTASFILFQMKRQQILVYYRDVVTQLETWEE